MEGEHIGKKFIKRKKRTKLLHETGRGPKGDQRSDVVWDFYPFTP
jgi:hypothetical protein